MNVTNDDNLVEVVKRYTVDSYLCMLMASQQLLAQDETLPTVIDGDGGSANAINMVTLILLYDGNWEPTWYQA